MNLFRSITFQIWLRFETIVAAMLVFTYLFLVVLFPSFYEWMKIEEISQSLMTIQLNWYNKDALAITDRVSVDNKLYIEIYFPDMNRSVTFNNMGGGLAITNVSKLGYQEEIRNSDTGIVYRRFRDERENNSVLMVCSMAGGTRDDPDAYIFICSYLQPLGTTVAIFQRQFLFVSVVIIILTFFVSLLFSQKISSPIIRINRFAKELPQGRFEYKASERDFAEIKQLTGTLEVASKEIAKSDDLRKELMSNISHDLRTPLTMIKAYAEMIRDLSGDNPEKRERHLKVIIDETDRLSSLVNDILDLSKLQAGVAELSLETFNFGERLGGVVSRFDILRENDGVIIELHAGDSILINADKVKLEQVVYNLINNAVTYTGDDNTVIVRLYRTINKTVRFEVTDHGDGIAPEYLPYIWDRYYKVSERNKTHKRAKMGSGIGLSIVKSVLEMHGFQYGVDSEVGKGSTFWFEAPDPLAAPDLEPTKTSVRIKKPKQ
ncbi:MAG: sensor histidine kinase [Oscillospiraceae bacterium]|nr:sensor histidine kinase [Oscillospiraceae bacterium]